MHYLSETTTLSLISETCPREYGDITVYFFSINVLLTAPKCERNAVITGVKKCTYEGVCVEGKETKRTEVISLEKSCYRLILSHLRKLRLLRPSSHRPNSGDTSAKTHFMRGREGAGALPDFWEYSNRTLKFMIPNA